MFLWKKTTTWVFIARSVFGAGNAMTDLPQNQTQTPMENNSDHFPDSDTRLQGSAMQVWSAPVPFSGGFTVEDFCNFSKDPRLMRRGTP
jgi:hypothetical protein